MTRVRRRRSPALRWAAAGAAAAAAVTLVIVGPAGPAQASAAIVVSNVTTSPGTTFTLSRSQTALVTLTFTIHSPDGQRRSFTHGGLTRDLPAVVEPGGGGSTVPRTVATLLSGTRKNGVWEAIVPLAAALDGTHDLAVQTCVEQVHCNRFGPQAIALGVTVTVHGSQWPVISQVAQSPARLPAGATRGAQAVGQVVYAGTSTPAAGVDITLARKGRLPHVVGHTDSQGQFISPWPWSDRRSGVAGTLSAQLPTSSGPVVTDTTTLDMPYGRFAIHLRHPQYASAGGRYVLTGWVSPGFPAPRLGRVALQRLVNGHWRTVDTSPVRAMRHNGHPVSRGQFRLSTTFSALGQATLRVTKSDALCHNGHCRVVGGHGSKFDVITGSRNELVEHQLAHFGFPVGAVDGVIDARAQQALCAWRDATGARPSRAGVTTAVARSVLNATHKPKAHRSDGLYVDKTCQVLFQVVGGKFKRIVWASTGMPGLDTPNVNGAIFRKIDGVVESTLYPGAFMYWPMFFNPARPAIALHGSVSNDLVLPYPASHGCIRVWRPEIKRIFDDSPIGTKVVVYGKY